MDWLCKLQATLEMPGELVLADLQAEVDERISAVRPCERARQKSELEAGVDRLRAVVSQLTSGDECREAVAKSLASKER